MKSCVAQTAGHPAVVLCVFIAHTEDAARYTGAITFHNEILCSMTGFATWRAFDKARKAAVESGWLRYVPSPAGSHLPGTYWTTIPKHAARLNPYLGDDGVVSVMRAAPNGAHIGAHIGAPNDQPNGAHNIHSPIPNPIPIPPDGAVFESGMGEPVTDLEFVMAWNAAGCVRPVNGSCLSVPRRQVFQERLLDPGWDWRAALAKFPLACVESDTRPDRWMPDLDWFLKPDTVGAILEGKYDFRRGGAKAEEPHRARPITSAEIAEINRLGSVEAWHALHGGAA